MRDIDKSLNSVKEDLGRDEVLKCGSGGGFSGEELEGLVDNDGEVLPHEVSAGASLDGESNCGVHVVHIRCSKPEIHIGPYQTINKGVTQIWLEANKET